MVRMAPAPADKAHARYRLLAVVGMLLGSVALTATFSFASGYMMAAQHVKAMRLLNVDPTRTTGLSDSFVSVSVPGPPLQADGQKIEVVPEVKSAVAVPDGSAAKTEAVDKTKVDSGPLAKEDGAEPPRVKVDRAMLYKGWPCSKDERLFNNLCYVDCGVATGGVHPSRVDSCTCCKEVPCIQTVGRFTKNCQLLNAGDDAQQPAPPKLPNCHTEDEELWMGLCYKKCSTLTKDRYPVRTGFNTCSSHIAGSNWTMGIGPCSGFGVGGGDQCLPHIPLPIGMGYNAKGEAGYPPMGFGFMAMEKTMLKQPMTLMQRPR